MTGTAELKLETFLRTDPRDVGCEQAMEVLNVYAELMSRGDGSGSRMPGVEAHLRACGPCSEDCAGLLAALALMANGRLGQSAGPAEPPERRGRA